MAFIENKFSGDPTNWWVPNPAAVKAMFRSAGLKFMHRPEEEIYIFQPDSINVSVNNKWNRSEYLSATGKPWIA